MFCCLTEGSFPVSWSLSALSGRKSLMDHDVMATEHPKAECHWHYWKETSLVWMVWPRGNMCSLNSRGPWMDPWGTPHDMETLRLMITSRNNIILSFQIRSDLTMDCTLWLFPHFLACQDRFHHQKLNSEQEAPKLMSVLMWMSFSTLKAVSSLNPDS